MNTIDISIAPIISEKSTKDAGLGRFTFRVSKKADKGVIRKVIEEKFKVNVTSVYTNIVKGRKQRFGKRRVEQAMPSFKKAIVKLQSGQKIDLFETGEKS